MLEIRPISIAAANAYVEAHHRHHGKKTGCRFAVAIYEQDELHGVAICSNPVGRNADDGRTLEVARCCADGTRNACSMLYGACARIAKDMGFRKVQTYILASELGTSLKAAGWICEGEAGRASWLVNASQRTLERVAEQQLSLFGEKKPPAERKKRYAKYFGGIR